MEIIAFAAIYLSILILPGVALLPSCFRNGASVIASSFAFFVLLFFLCWLLNLSTFSFTIIFCGSLLASVLLIWLKRSQFDWQAMLPYLLIGIVSLIYQSLFSSFSEVPSDAYAHLERIKFANDNLELGTLGFGASLTGFFQQGSGVFYFLIALSQSLSNIDARSAFEGLDFINRTLFLAVVFSFTKTIFKHSGRASLTAYFAVFFVAAHMGINVFAYIRYYTIAPSIIAFSLYFSAISLFLNCCHNPDSVKKLALSALAIFFLALAAAATHVQEALFIVIVIPLMAIWWLITNRKPQSGRIKVNPVFFYTIVIAAAFSFVLAYMLSNQHLERAPNAHWRLWEFAEAVWIFPKITVLNLKFQFIQVITLWGLFVLACAVFYWRRYIKNLYIMAALSVPLVTILNPFFIDLFLRHYNSTTVWRLCYLIPIHFIAADLSEYHWSRLNSSSMQFAYRFRSAVFLMLVVALLLPIANTWNQTHFSRVPTLASSDPQLSYKHYGDLLDFLAELPSQKVLTDPMTGYMVSALSKHHSNRRKFFRGKNFIRFSFLDYTHKPLSQFRDHLIIVNQRPNSKSVVGKLSGHWREIEWLDIHNYYPTALLERLKSDDFEKLWENEEVSVYRIK